MERKADGLLRLLWLHEYRHSPISSYSKGMKQRVLIAGALLHDPDVLILDEPLSGLDITSALLLHELIAELARHGKTILYISHVLEVTEKVCSRVIMLYQGKIVANDEVGRLRDLMNLPSLEMIFRQLAKQEDVGASAREIVAVMQEALMRSAFTLLVGHFLGRFFDNEIVSQEGDMRTNVVQALGLVGRPGNVRRVLPAAHEPALRSPAGARRRTAGQLLLLRSLLHGGHGPGDGLRVGRPVSRPQRLPDPHAPAAAVEFHLRRESGGFDRISCAVRGRFELPRRAPVSAGYRSGSTPSPPSCGRM